LAGLKKSTGEMALLDIIVLLHYCIYVSLSLAGIILEHIYYNSFSCFFYIFFEDLSLFLTIVKNLLIMMNLTRKN